MPFIPKNNPKITIVGAGGYEFPIRLINDILSYDSMSEVELCLMDVSLTRAARTEKLAKKLIKKHRPGAKVWRTKNLDEAFEGCDFGIICFQVGGIEAYRQDKEIAAKHGVDLPVGDTLNSGGVFRGLRSLGAMQEIAAAIHTHCPDALILNYANPMAINCWGLSNMGVNVVGLCHSVQAIPWLFGMPLDIPSDEIDFQSFGINHQAWVTEAYHKGEDIYPAYREAMFKKYPSPLEVNAKTGSISTKGLKIAFDHGGHYHYEMVRTEIMRTFGYFHTESSHHGSEYTPWFRKNKKTVKAYIKKRWDYYEMCLAHDATAQERWTEDQVEKEKLEASGEYGSHIINAILTNTPYKFFGNVPNWGKLGDRGDNDSTLISNLPQNACVEVACFADRYGIHPSAPGALPAQCAAINRTNINVQSLTVEASETGDPQMIEMAIAMDPLTGALLTLPAIRALTADMLKANKKWLPQFEL